MGEVYRARDTKLNRDVALKVLPDAFALEPDRLARFRREAQVLAALNHPNIAAIHGFEEGTVVGAGFSRLGGALVLELIEGPTLADRIAEGPLPWEEALPIAKQIVDALGAAHEHGIVHRDLKPANIKVREDGAVKVLDFGLAKALEGETAPADASMSSTLTAAATRVGVILGTAAYMAPEQARGKAVDRRADIWAFGCVVYEMLTGKRAFDSGNFSDTLAAILGAEPDWALLERVPAAVRLLLRRCLEKNPRNRVADISTARFVLDEAANLVATTDLPAVASPLWRRSANAMALAVTAALIAASVVWVAMRADSPIIERFTITSSGTASVAFGAGDRDLVLSPDGSTLFYIGNNRTQLLSRPFDQLEPIALFTGEDLWLWHFGNRSLTRLTFDPAIDYYPVWAPDGRRVIFGSRRSEGVTEIYEQQADGTGRRCSSHATGREDFPRGSHPTARRSCFSSL